MTGIEPRMTSSEAGESVRIIHAEQCSDVPMSARERPILPGAKWHANGTAPGGKGGCNTTGAGQLPQGVTAALSNGTRGQRIREGGDTGDTRPRAVSPSRGHVSAVQQWFGDTGDTGDTFCTGRGAPLSTVLLRVLLHTTYLSHE
jgi:hypothetical protein